jgi:hypothetical protein
MNTNDRNSLRTQVAHHPKWDKIATVAGEHSQLVCNYIMNEALKVNDDQAKINSVTPQPGDIGYCQKPEEIIDKAINRLSDMLDTKNELKVPPPTLEAWRDLIQYALEVRCSVWNSDETIVNDICSRPQ